MVYIQLILLPIDVVLYSLENPLVLLGLEDVHHLGHPSQVLSVQHSSHILQVLLVVSKQLVQFIPGIIDLLLEILGSVGC